MEWVLLTPSMPDFVFCTNGDIPRCFYQHHDFPLNGVCDLQADVGHFPKNANVSLLFILNCYPQEKLGSTSCSQPFPFIWHLRKQHKSSFLQIFHLLVKVDF